jgi:hypothetical protein
MLEYVALGMLLLSLTALFYIFIFIHDLPHRIAKKRAHPQAEAIHYACWLSLFTLHAIWPLVFLWAVSNRGALDVRVVEEADGGSEADVTRLGSTLAEVERRLAALERGVEAGQGGTRGGAS